MNSLTIAVAGNPNAGKTTLFNVITGSRQQVGNYPGVTVEMITGECLRDGHSMTFVDLPGTYSLTAYSQEELVARSYIVDEHPDVVLNVVDASNLERNLYLTLQLAEMGVPMVVALNMHDVARRRGIHIDIERLSTLLGVPVVATVGHRGEGIRELLDTLAATAERKSHVRATRVVYSPAIESGIAELEALIAHDNALAGRHDNRWMSIKILEADERALARVRDEAARPTPLLDLAGKLGLRIRRELDDDVATHIAEHRYGHAAGIVRECITVVGDRTTFSDAIDTIVCNRVLGFPIVGLVVYLTFKLTFALADGWAYLPWAGEWRTPVGVLGWVFEEWLPGLTASMAEGSFKDLLDQGIIAGVGGVVGFVPFIFFMFIFLGIIEDSGYIARIAFVFDRMLRIFGLQGKSIMALIVSGGIAGGCAVPGVMATRTLREEKDRLTTMLVAPFMNCGAKLPVFAMLIAAFYSEYEGEMMLLITVLSWAFALIAALLLRKFIIKGEQTPFVMELPPYHRPTFQGVFRSAFSRGWMYIRKAGTVILGVSILIWALMNYPKVDTTGKTDIEASSYQLTESAAGSIGRALEPVSRLAGFDWRDNIALIGGFAAKEVILSTMATSYRMEEGEDAAGLIEGLKADPDWNPLRALSMLLFIMLYAPCFVTVVAIAREAGSWKWAFFSMAYTTALAFFVATVVYQVGKLAIGG